MPCCLCTTSRCFFPTHTHSFPPFLQEAEPTTRITLSSGIPLKRDPRRFGMFKWCEEGRKGIGSKNKSSPCKSCLGWKRLTVFFGQAKPPVLFQSSQSGKKKHNCLMTQIWDWLSQSVCTGHFLPSMLFFFFFFSYPEWCFPKYRLLHNSKRWVIHRWQGWDSSRKRHPSWIGYLKRNSVNIKTFTYIYIYRHAQSCLCLLLFFSQGKEAFLPLKILFMYLCNIRCFYKLISLWWICLILLFPTEIGSRHMMSMEILYNRVMKKVRHFVASPLAEIKANKHLL